MKLRFPLFSSRLNRTLALVACFGLAVVGPASHAGAAAATPAATGPKLELSDKISERMGAMAKILDEANTTKNWAPAIDGLTAMLKDSARGSYDEFYTAQLLAQVYAGRGQKGDYAAAIPLLEIVVNSPIFPHRPNNDFVFLLAQLFLTENDAKNAEKYSKRFLELVPKPPLDRIVFHVSLLLQRSETIDPVTKKPVTQKEVVTEALSWINKGMRMQAKPDERLLLMKAVANIALERYDAAAETLELAVHIFPKNKQYWPQLYNLYANAQRDLRAALTIERAQAEGMMNTPKENIVLVGIYYNLRRYDRAIELLEKGLTDGSIESTPQNWELLASTYIQARRELKAIDVYQRASKEFPDTGKYYALITQIYFGMENYREAFKYAEMAMARGVQEKPAQMGLFTVFLAYELKLFEKAAEYLTKVEPMLQTDRDRQDFRNLKNAVDGALEAAKHAETAAVTPAR